MTERDDLKDTEADMTTVEPGQEPVIEPAPIKPRPRWVALLMTPTNGVWAGLALVAGGIGLIFVAWARVAGLVNVALQTPYLVSAGITGLGLVAAGLAAVDVAVLLQDRPERKQQVAQIERALDELHSRVR